MMLDHHDLPFFSGCVFLVKYAGLQQSCTANKTTCSMKAIE
jgi:hypothetical protein